MALISNYGDGVSREWIARFVSEQWDRQCKLRQKKEEDAAKVIAIREGYARSSSGEYDVKEKGQWREQMVRSMLSTWAGLMTGVLFPQNTAWLRLKPYDPQSKEMNDAITKLFWNKLTVETDFIADMQKAIHDAGELYGVVVMLNWEADVDPMKDKFKQAPSIEVIPFWDFVLDSNSNSRKKSYLITRKRFSKEMLLAEAKDNKAQDGTIIDKAMFDEAAVRRVIADKKGMCGMPSGESPAENAKNVARTEQDGDGWYEVKFFYGQPFKDEISFPENQLWITCGDEVLYAGDNRHPFIPVYLGGEPSSVKDPYYEGKGYPLACIEEQINDLMTVTGYARRIKAYGVMQFDPENGGMQRFIKYKRHFKMAPGNWIPDISAKSLPYLADMSDVRADVLDLRQKAQELVGTPFTARGNPGKSGVTATAIQEAKGGQVSRNGDDALYFSPSVHDLLDQMLWVLLNLMEEPEIVYLDDGSEVVITPEMAKQYRGCVCLESLALNSLTGVRQQQVMWLRSQLAQSPYVRFNELDKLTAMESGYPAAIIEKLIKTQEEVDAEQQQAQQAQQQAMAAQQQAMAQENETKMALQAQKDEAQLRRETVKLQAQGEENELDREHDENLVMLKAGVS